MHYIQPLFDHIDVEIWAFVAGTVHLVSAVLTVVHILLRKENEGSAVSWIGVVLLSPFLGVVLYWMFGINRIKRQPARTVFDDDACMKLLEENAKTHTAIPEKWQGLMRTGCAIHHDVYMPGNSVTLLRNGDEAYPRMLEAIKNAKTSIFLSTYIFDYDVAGKQFIEALTAAKARGVVCYVLIDGIATSVSWRRTVLTLNRRGIETARFLPKRFLSVMRFINLRNHRKILSIDGETAFVGGLNIDKGNILKIAPRRPVQDIHFEIRGPVIRQIDGVFCDDWKFSTNRDLKLPESPIENAGQVIGRVLPDGPDENYLKLVWTLLGAINAAEKNIRIATPYFIPDDILTSALQAASLRGVEVEVIVPQKNNIWFFDWAMRANFKKFLTYGLKMYLSKPPFAHTKLFLVDDQWSFIGSSNWDARSLILNFEINLECYEAALNAELSEFFESYKATSVSVSKGEDSLPRQLLNNLVRLFSPYL